MTPTRRSEGFNKAALSDGTNAHVVAFRDRNAWCATSWQTITRSRHPNRPTDRLEPACARPQSRTNRWERSIMRFPAPVDDIVDASHRAINASTSQNRANELQPRLSCRILRPHPHATPP